MLVSAKVVDPIICGGLRGAEQKVAALKFGKEPYVAGLLSLIPAPDVAPESPSCSEELECLLCAWW